MKIKKVKLGDLVVVDMEELGVDFYKGKRRVCFVNRNGCGTLVKFLGDKVNNNRIEKFADVVKVEMKKDFEEASNDYKLIVSIIEVAKDLFLNGR